jgi:hypothetical protein
MTAKLILKFVTILVALRGGGSVYDLVVNKEWMTKESCTNF